MTFENIVENGAFAQIEQILHFPQCFQSTNYCFQSTRKSSYSLYTISVYKYFNSKWNKGVTGIIQAMYAPVIDQYKTSLNHGKGLTLYYNKTITMKVNY